MLCYKGFDGLEQQISRIRRDTGVLQSLDLYAVAGILIEEILIIQIKGDSRTVIAGPYIRRRGASFDSGKNFEPLKILFNKINLLKIKRITIKKMVKSRILFWIQCIRFIDAALFLCFDDHFRHG